MPYGEGTYGEGPYGEDFEAFAAARSISSTGGQDFKIETSVGQGQMTFEKADNIMNNIYLSIMVEKGSFFFNPDFGLKKRSDWKNSDRYTSLLVEDIKDALQWIIDLGRAVKFDIYTERDKLVDLHRLKLSIEATQADGRVVTFETFMEVV